MRLKKMKYTIRKSPYSGRWGWKIYLDGRLKWSSCGGFEARAEATSDATDSMGDLGMELHEQYSKE
jgi:hypothetical protein